MRGIYHSLDFAVVGTEFRHCQGVYDTIRLANGIPLDSHAAVERVIAEVLAGETLTLLIERGGADMTLTPDLEQILSGVR